jgi:aldose 1-epimerase
MAGGEIYMRIAVVLLCSLFAIFLPVAAATRVTKQPFGKTPDGTAVDLFTLSNDGIEVRILTYGGAIQSLQVPDRHGKMADVVLGYDTLDGYFSKDDPYFGALVGRYANRIASGRFELGGHTYTIPTNNGPNALHGGPRGFDKVVWKAKKVRAGIELSYVSPDGDQGFPGTLTAIVRYTLKSNALRIDYAAMTDRPTVVNLTNHTYFALGGQGSGDILGHELMIAASRFTPVDSSLIPSGELRSVEGTPFDFRRAHRIGERIEQEDEQLRFGGGYDHNWVLYNNSGGRLVKAAELYDRSSGRALEVLTTQPGLQFYSGNFLDGTIIGKGRQAYNHRYGLCLETQHFPDSPNHANFPSTELRPGQKYHSVTIFHFATR